jgi:D-alanyl-D-alanine-carboxypeptidase/D-alanyl-D-alanine-endopeptidase
LSYQVAALLLCDMVEKGEVKLEDPVSKYLPDSVSEPSRSGKQITLLDLGTHYSGLPDYPSNLSTAPGSKYTVEQLYEFLSRYRRPRDPGSSFKYSNIGMGLLAIALSHRSGRDLEALLKERIFRPLGMPDTGIALRPEPRERSTEGHDRDLHAIEWIDWKDQAMAGAGALHSNAEDMLRFAAAVLGNFEHPL